MTEEEQNSLRAEVSGLREVVLSLLEELRLNRGSEKDRVSGVAIKASDLMNGFQGALAKAVESRYAAGNENSEDISEYIVHDLEVEFAAPLVAERGEDEPVLIIPNVKNVTEDSPLVRLKFKVGSATPGESA